MSKQKSFNNYNLKKIIAISVVFFIAVAGLILGAYVYYKGDKIIPDTTYGELIKGGASQRPILKEETFNKQFENYPAFLANIDKSLPLPGLQGAWTLPIIGKEKPIKINTYDIQGVTSSPKNIFISAYDSAQQGRSIIYVLDKKTGNYLKSLILPDDSHAGGITYDNSVKMLWITGRIDDKAVINGIGQYQIDQYDFAKQIKNNPKKPQSISYDMTVRLPDIDRASAVTLFDRKLWVGYFDSLNNGKLQNYKIVRHLADGQVSIGTQKKDYFVAHPSYDNETIARLQGIAINKKYVYMSSSFGNKSSLIVRFQLSKNGDKLVKPIYIAAPPYLEQISLDGENLYAVFESATPRYRIQSQSIVDRLLVVKTADFEKYASKYHLEN